MATVTKTFSDAGFSEVLFLKQGEGFTYAVDYSADFDGGLFLEYSDNGGQSWSLIRTFAVGYITDVDTTPVANAAEGSYRFRCILNPAEETLTGTAAVTLTDVAEALHEFKDKDGKVILAVTDAGIVVTGTASISGALTQEAASAVMIAPASTSPAQTAEGSIVWDSNDDLLTVGDGTSRKVMVDTGSTQTLVGKTLTSPTLTTPTLGVATATSLKCTAGVGTANAGTTAVEYGDGRTHQTVLTVSTTLPAIAGGADLGVGKLLYTLPAGAHVIESAYMSIAITQSEANITADTPDVGLGTVIATGAVATLDGTGTFEDIITGQTAADCDGAATVKTAIPTANLPLIIEAAGAKTIHLNVADGWAASGDLAAAVAGTVVINWRTMA